MSSFEPFVLLGYCTIVAVHYGGLRGKELSPSLDIMGSFSANKNMTNLIFPGIYTN